MVVAIAPKFIGEVQSGKLKLNDQALYDDYLLTLDGKVELVVRKYHSQRTLKQSAYYWGVVVRMIADETGHTSDEIHEMLKRMFLKDLIEIKGEQYETVKSTTSLDTRGFSKDYVDRIKLWALDTLGITIPESDEVYF